MDILTQGNLGRRVPHILADELVVVSGSEWASAPVPLTHAISGILSLIWVDFDAADAVAHIQGSYDGSLWNNLDGAGCAMDTAADVQLWEFNSLNVLYLRLYVNYGSLTTGEFAMQFRGEFNTTKD
jgi:hypothetical protein